MLVTDTGPDSRLVDDVDLEGEDHLVPAEVLHPADFEPVGERGVVVAGADGNIILSDARTSEIFGYEPESFSSLLELVAERFRSLVRALLENLEGEISDQLVYGVRQDGTEFPLSLSVREALGDVHDRVFIQLQELQVRQPESFSLPSLESITRLFDIFWRSSRLLFSDERRSLLLGYLRQAGDDLEILEGDGASGTENIRMLYNLLPQLLDTLHIGLYITTPGDENHSGAIVHLNPAICRMLGYDSMEALIADRGTDPAALYFEPTERDDRMRLLRTDGVRHADEIYLRHREGHPVYARVDTLTVPGSDGEMNIGVLLDRTKERALRDQRDAVTEQAHVDREQLAAGRLFGSLAHRMNGLLTVIVCRIHMALNRLQDVPNIPENVQADLREALESIETMNVVVERMRAFGQETQLDMRRENLVDIFKHWEVSLPPHIPNDAPGIQLVFQSSLESHEGLVHIDAQRLESILMEMILNACHAIEGAGMITIDASHVSLDSAEGGDVPLGHYARIRVTDTGCGIHPAHLASIFEPFFTPEGIRGTRFGLGLSAAHGLIHQMGGYIEVESTQGEGTTFSMYFPIVREED